MSGLMPVGEIPRSPKARNLSMFFAVVRREICRCWRIRAQVLLPSVIMTLLQLLIWGKFLGPKWTDSGDIPYGLFILPGLLISAVINNAFSNVSSSIFPNKQFGIVESFMVTPVPRPIFILGAVSGGMFRAIVTSWLIWLAAFFMEGWRIAHPFLLIGLVVVVSFLFSLLGLLVALLARSFDDIGWITLFVVTPLTYLSGTFFNPKNITSSFWSIVIAYNPMTHMVTAARSSSIGLSEDCGLRHFELDIALLLLFSALLFLVTWWLLERDWGNQPH